MMRDDFKVRVEGIRFDAAHFATFGGNCEPLHGHSYEVAAEVDGGLTEDSWVVSFQSLKALLREMSKQLDHRFLLQRHSTILEIETTETAWKVRTPEGIGYVLPKPDVVALPIDNTTAERISEWFCSAMWSALEEKGAHNLRSLAVDVWEGPGQRGSYRMVRLPLE
jgi:6-pyruvoyltetrahydropterin/6-carboxytetrahydropterin synthase